MARVLICASKGTSIGDWETMKRIAGTIERDARDYVWQVYVPCPNTFEIDRCRTSDFGIHKPGYGLGYYATIIKNDSFKKFVGEFARYRQDIITSDREAAAFMFTMESFGMLN